VLQIIAFSSSFELLGSGDSNDPVAGNLLKRVSRNICTPESLTSCTAKAAIDDDHYSSAFAMSNEPTDLPQINGSA
jgi:hypothetical protein